VIKSGGEVIQLANFRKNGAIKASIALLFFKELIDCISNFIWSL